MVAVLKDEIKIKVEDTELVAKYRTFSTGKKGYGCYGIIKINDYPYRISLNLIEM